MAKINFFGRHSLLARIVATLVLIITLSMLYRNMFTRESVLPRDGFSWLSYLDQNPVHINKRYAAVLSHFEEKGKAKGLNYAQITPSDAELSSLASSVTKFVTKCSQRKKGVNPLNVVIYNVQRFDAKSADIVLLNLQLFLSTIEPDSCKSSVRTFYVFNVADGERNLHSTYIPDNLSNSAILHWHGASEGNELYRSFRTMELMTSDLLTRFGAVFLLSSRIRGPLGGRTRGGWMQTYRRLLDQQDVAVVAPIIACSDEAPTTPELHAYAVAIRSSFAVNIVEEFRVIKYIPSSAEATLKSEFDRLVGHGHDSLLVKLGYRAASIAQFKLGDMSYYSNECSAEGRKKEPVRHQVYKADAWCQLELEDRIFVPWGGMHARGGEYACENARQSMRKYLSKFISTQTAETSQIEEAMGQRIEPFETIIVDSLSDLYRQFTEEERREHLALSARPVKSVRARPSDCEGGNYSTNPVSLTATDSVEVAENSQVCFLVRTSEMHDSVVHQPEDGKYIEMDLFGFIKSKLSTLFVCPSFILF